MSRLDELITELCPTGMDFKPLEQCCTILDNRRKPITKASRQAGVYPYYGANGIQDYVADYIFDGIFILVGEDGSVITPNGNPIVNWAEGKIWVNNHAHIAEEKDGILLRYLYHYLQTVNVSPYIHGNIPKLTGGDFRNIQIPVPPLPVQQEMVRILDSFTELTAELTAELAARKKQYEYYQEKLLDFGDKVEWKTIGEIATVSDYVANGSFASLRENVQYIHKPDFAVLIRTVDYSTGFDPTKFIYIDEHAYNFLEKSKLFGGEIIINNIGAGVGTTFRCPKLNTYMSLAPNSIMVSTPNDDFYYYWFISKYGQDAIQKVTSQSSMPKFNKTGFRSIMVPVPSQEEQRQVVEILDKFYLINNSIYYGLPAEIAARQKQYEYYRDKLLSFKEAEVSQ